MIVEDEFLIAMDLQRTLEHHGWRVLGPVANVRDALKVLAVELPSVALLDINLGRELVTPVAAALLANGVPFVIASAYSRPEEIGGEIFAGVLNVGKPVRQSRLLTALAELTTG
jgi:DNA-binding NtrC family response regulator